MSSEGRAKRWCAILVIASLSAAGGVATTAALRPMPTTALLSTPAPVTPVPHLGSGAVEVVVPKATPKPKPEPRPTHRPIVHRAVAPRVAAPVHVAAARPVASSTQVVPFPAGGSEAYTALLVGVEAPVGSDPLPGAKEDAYNVRTALLARGFKNSNVKVLTGSAATHANIINGLDWLANVTNGKGLAVFMESSHSGMSGGDMTFATAGGGRVARHDVASRLGHVRGKVWSMFNSCYSDSYAVPGITGTNRIAITSTPASKLSYTVPGNGSWSVWYTVEKAMNEQHVNTIEGAYRWAISHLTADGHPDRLPIIHDGISGDTKVGP